ncbi:flavin-containing monooxygenase [Dermatobacter hominis]|uniref:flavin-containing monooxygenase n=1 Tax=Dermatobacter hominis TaxID=2884263 RepID=UPI001D12A92C|nr:NAD(P)/FAD-dependent oxidoreductase [Dermatobacter hominis]UDY34473.1 NAD(P)/FAD-dependent oxidoreductase [Dermatobacter hominis]
MRNPHAGTPFDTSDEEIAAALEDVSIPTLMLSMVHMTGDPSIIRSDLRPVASFLNEVQGFMSEEDKATVRARALEVIKDYRDRGCPEPEPLSRDLIHEMMEWLVVEDVPDEYVPLMLDDLALDGRDHDHVDAPATAEQQAARAEFPVVVIGCGQSGLLAGIRLQEAGIPFTIVEKNAGVGGTWWENTYPGARVDVGNHFYCYTFEPSDHWTEYFAQQPELQAYFQGVMERNGIEPHVRWSTEVVSATWDEATDTWQVVVRGVGPDGRPTGEPETLTARAVITAVGQLNRPSIPDIEGKDDFAGPNFHTARWDHDVDLTGKRVAMIGAGATGFQVAPAICEQVEHLTVFQRTAQWMFPNPNYHEQVGPGVRWALRHLPFYGRWYRFLLFWPGCDKGLEPARVDPDYTDPEGGQQRSISEISDGARAVFTDWIVSQIGDDPELIAKVVPDYPATGKRTLQDNGTWLKTLTRDDVDLVRTGIDHIEPDAIVTGDGERYPCDVIIWATGFHHTKVLWPMDIIGRDGTLLSDVWGERPAAYLGITVPEFPNLFLMYGPGTHLAHGASLIFNSECQMHYISQCLDELIDGEHRSMEPLPERLDDWHRRHQEEMSMLVWAQPSIEHSYFKNSKGEIHTVMPFRVVDYWQWTRELDPADFTFR